MLVPLLPHEEMQPTHLSKAHMSLKNRTRHVMEKEVGIPNISVYSVVRLTTLYGQDASLGIFALLDGDETGKRLFRETVQVKGSCLEDGVFHKQADKRGCDSICTLPWKMSWWEGGTAHVEKIDGEGDVARLSIAQSSRCR